MPNPPTDKTILIIDDDREIASMLHGVLTGNGYKVYLAPNGIEGKGQIENLKPDLVITDMMMPRMGGFPVLEFLKTLEAPPAVIMITANEGGRHKAYAEMLGVADYLRKPFPMEVLLESVRRIFAAKQEDADKDKPAPIKRAARKKAAKPELDGEEE
ncbi:response regulator transcription factor [Schlesneria paludicola]|uniref:response regulator transcription factor n=1 Tax=Schlesneria paludicola TaxID=360056 RepID=UPI00029A02CC|nr:response regulator [Schlesneria paludicola]